MLFLYDSRRILSHNKYSTQQIMSGNDDYNYSLFFLGLMLMNWKLKGAKAPGELPQISRLLTVGINSASVWRALSLVHLTWKCR